MYHHRWRDMSMAKGWYEPRTWIRVRFVRGIDPKPTGLVYFYGIETERFSHTNPDRGKDLRN
jgi:hypothetical protein